MKLFNLSAAMMAASMLMAAPVFAQQAAAPQKQKTQEGGPSMPDVNANQGTLKQGIQSEVPSMANPTTNDAAKK
jgi:hypothetical protein